MKNILFIGLAVFSVSAFALTGFLDKQWTEGSNKYCKYSNGKIVTVASYQLCPLSIDQFFYCSTDDIFWGNKKTSP